MDNEVVQAAFMQILACLVHIIELGQGPELVPVGRCQEHLMLVQQRQQFLRFGNRHGLDNEFLAEIQRKVVK